MTDRPSAMVGRRFSQYRIVDRLGAGGMGEVYRAHDGELDREVAIKVLPESVSEDPERLDRFEREARILASVNHPNIVTIFEVGGVDFGRYLVMEVVEGRTLDELIPGGGLSVERVLSIGVALADALAAAHDRGVVHRDLKPGNVMVSGAGRVKVLDFGLAKLQRRPEADLPSEAVTEGMTAHGQMIGTVPYMSPEQLRGAEADHRSDIFALGLILHQMATGARAFQGSSSADVAAAILREQPARADALRGDLPRHLGRIIARCLEKDPERRWQSAKDVRNELQGLAKELETEKILASATQSPQPAEPRKAHWRLFFAGMAVVVLVAGVLIAPRLTWHQSGTPERSSIASLAVLPFDNLMGDPDQDYFVEGMHEALITDLSKVGALRVISRTSAMRYRNTDKSIPEIARELEVDALIEGSVFRADDQVRITAQLIHGATDEHLWADSYDRKLDDVLSILSEVAQAITREIQVTVTPEQQRRLERASTVDPEVQDRLLRARFHFNSMDQEGFSKARELYREVVELDPSCAAGWAGRAGMEFVHGFFGYEPLAEAMIGAEEFAKRALRLDPDSSGALAIKGSVDLFWHWDRQRARPSLLRAVELDPNNQIARHALADYYMVTGNQDGSVRQVREGARRDPMSMMTLVPLVGHLSFAGRYDEAIAEAERAIELFPNVGFFQIMRARNLWWRGSFEEALKEYEVALGVDSDYVKSMRAGFEQGGPSVAMRNAAEYLASLPDPDPLYVAQRFAEAGESDLAFEWLEKGVRAHRPQVLHAAGHPAYRSIRDDPRFADLIGRIGMPVE